MPNRVYRSAAQMAARQRNISVSEFFSKNRHLLGFDSPYKAVLTSVKEAVDNALDACEEAGILPEVSVEISKVRDDVYCVSVEDNGPGIAEEQVGRIFGKLLYGSKFHKLSQSRGQQGMGIAAAGMYGQLTTGKPMRIRTRTGRRQPAWEMLVSIDTAKNRPEVRKKRKVDWKKAHGTRVEITMEGQHRSGAHSVERYLRLTAVANPHVSLRYVAPDGSVHDFARSSPDVPEAPTEIKPHPHGVELGRLIHLLKHTEHKHLGSFLREEFSRVGSVTAKQIIARVDGLSARSYPKRVAKKQAAALHRAITRTKISAPTTDCVVPIGQAQIIAGLERELAADLYLATSRPPAVYRGNPFVVEVGVAYGRPGDAQLELDADGRIQKRPAPELDAEELIAAPGDPVALMRFANRVPLMFQQSACIMTKAVIDTNWKAYGVSQAKGALPIAPMALFIHVASVWVPFTSESKEAVAAYDEIHKELLLALRECGRGLKRHISKHKRLQQEHERRTHITTFLPHIAHALGEMLELESVRQERLIDSLDQALLRRRRKR